MKTLITGGAGFIGSHLADALIEKGHEVGVIDDFSTGRPENVAHLAKHPRFRLTTGSILDEEMMRKLVAETDVVYHLAAAVGVKLVMEEPVRMLQNNLRSGELVLKFCSEFRKKVFVASSSEVYGRHCGLRPLSESDDRIYGSTMVGRWSYAAAKSIDEFLSFAYHQETKLEVIVGRLFNTIGPRQTGHYGMVVPRFVKAALDGLPLVVYGDGAQSRSFTYVGDAVRAMLQLMDSSGAAGQVFNIGGEETIEIRALAEKIKEMTGSSSEIRFVPYQQVYGSGFVDMEFRTPSLEKIQKQTGYRPAVCLNVALEKVIAYFRENESVAS